MAKEEEFWRNVAFFSGLFTGLLCGFLLGAIVQTILLK